MSSFWSPLPIKRNNNFDSQHIINPHFKNIKPTNITLPNNYTFQYDITNYNELNEFLNKNYEQNLSVFTIDYLKWILKDAIIIIVTNNDSKIVGFIYAKPITYKVINQHIDTYYTDLLCTHKKVRGKKLARLLMREMYNKVYDKSVGLIFNLDKQYDKMISIVESPKWLCRPLNIDKLSTTIFSKITDNQKKLLIEKYENSIQPNNLIQHIKNAEQKDILDLMDIYNDHNSNYSISHILNRYDFENIYMNEFVHTYVIAPDKIQDFFSYYISHTKKGETYAYIYYITYPNEELLKYIIISILNILKNENVDMVFILDIYDVNNILKNTYSFTDTGKTCHYHTLNYDTNVIEKSKCGLIFPRL